ncbi:Glycoside hydrolase family 17 [Dillenia turbinata]|uniref:Glycoside hydrolase family 17 n=1 Tax=Dillenia turbinata TaxID=194707 RepID=A0AAN8Z555_9MAGN
MLSPGAQLGVNYGMIANNLPTPSQVISLCQSKKINYIRIFHPDHTVLTALQNSGIKLIMGPLNQDLPSLAQDQTFANNWVQTYINPYKSSIKFRYLAMGNEVIPGDLSSYVLPAMKRVKTALRSYNISIRVTTSVASQVLGQSFPPSVSTFSEESKSVMTQIAQYLESKRSSLLVNLCPYFAYAGEPDHIRLDYAIFNTSQVIVTDGACKYSNMLDAMMDSMYWALRKAGAPNVRVVASETGWPSAGDRFATVDLAKTYNNNLVKHVKSQKMATPLKPEERIEAYIFALFNENLKPAGVEQNFGLFYPSMEPVYPVKL